MINQGNTNLITTGPNLADAVLTDYYSELQHNTNYVESIIQHEDKTYVSSSETQAAITYRDAFRQGDITAALNNFYNYLINKSFNNNTFSFDTILYWYFKLSCGNKELISLNNAGSLFGNKIVPNLKPAVSGNMFSSFLNGITNQLGDTLGSLSNLLGSVKNLNGDQGNGLSSLLGTPANTAAVQQSFFGNVSDSIGTLANSKYLQLDSTLPIFDVDQNYYGVPIPYSCSTDSKISNNTRNIAYHLSQHTTALMRRNLLNIAYSIPAVQENMAVDSTVAHGLNLVNDLPTFVKINQALPTLVATLASKFKQPRVFQFIRFLSNIGNQYSYNLRDIFPATAQDKDFTVVTSKERALASAQERKALSDQAVIDSYLEQQGINYANQYPNQLTNTNIFGIAGGTSGGAAPPPSIVGKGPQWSPLTTPTTYSATDINVIGSDISAQLNSKYSYLTMTGNPTVDGGMYLNKGSAIDALTQRLSDSPLLTSDVNSPAYQWGKNLGVQDPSSAASWANMFWAVGNYENGNRVDAPVQDGGTSIGITSTNASFATSNGGYQTGLSVAQVANPVVNYFTTISYVEQTAQKLNQSNITASNALANTLNNAVSPRTGQWASRTIYKLQTGYPLDY